MKRAIDAILAAGAAALLALAPAPLWGQESDPLAQEAEKVRQRLWRIRQHEAALGYAEEYRLKGDCKAVRGYYTDIFSKPGFDPDLPPEVRADLQRRMQEIVLRECPPGSGRPSISLPPPAASDDILDEIGTDTDRTPTGLPVTPRTAPPVPPKSPEEVHVVPRPVPAPAVPTPPPVPPRTPDRTPVPQPPLVGRLPYVAPPLAEIILGEAENAAHRCDAAALETAIWELQELLRDAERVFFNASDAVEHAREGAKVHELRRILERALRLREQCTPPQVSAVPLDPISERLLALHNRTRAEVGAAPLQWDPRLAANAATYAQQLASGVSYAHSSRAGREKTERENLSMGRLGETPVQMIQLWMNEKANFVPGIFPNVSKTGDWYNVGHYSQMIWGTTTHVGCGSATGAQWEYLVCRYAPPGNKDGKPVGLPPTP